MMYHTLLYLVMYNRKKALFYVKCNIHKHMCITYAYVLGGHSLIGKTAILHIVISGSIPDVSMLKFTSLFYS